MPSAASSPATEIFKHAERLKYQDEDWKARDEALARLRVLITEGALATDGFIRGEGGFQANLKDLVHSIVTQLFDLRSVIARSAANTLELLMIEVGDHVSAEAPFCGDALEGLLQLASSANKVLAAAGRDAFPKFIDSVRFESIIKEGLLVWLRGNKTPAVKICCLQALLQALQTWPLPLLQPSNESIEVATVEAAANPMGEIRALARQCLLQHLANAPDRQPAIDKWLAKYPDTKKALQKEPPPSGSLGADERIVPLVRRGEAGAAARNGKLSGAGGAGGPSADPNHWGLEAAASARGPSRRPSLLRSLSSKTVTKGGKGKKAGTGVAKPSRVAEPEGAADARLSALELAAAALEHVRLSSAQVERLRQVAAVLEASLAAADAGDGAPEEGQRHQSAPQPAAPPAAPMAAMETGAGGGAGSGLSAMERMQALRARQHELSAEEYDAERKRILDSL